MKKILVVIGMITVTGILYACGGSSSKSSTGGGGTGTGITTTVAAPTIAATSTPIVTQTDAAKTANASTTLATSFASGSTFPSLGSLVGKPAADQAANGQRIITTVRDLRQRVDRLAGKQKSLGKQVAAAQTQACTDGGTMSFDTASNPVVLTYAACKSGYEYQNGTITMPQTFMTQASGTGALSANLTTITYASGGYTVKERESSMNFTMTIGSFDTSTGSENFSMNGSESTIDYLQDTSDKQSFENFSLNMTESTSGAVTATNMTINGSVSMDTFKGTTFTTTDTASGMTFKNLILTDEYNSGTFTDSLTINGIYAIKTIPACMDGTFIITTQMPLTTTATASSNGVTTGEMTVNDIGMVFNADGSVTATFNGTPQTITSYANVCSLSF